MIIKKYSSLLIFFVLLFILIAQCNSLLKTKQALNLQISTLEKAVNQTFAQKSKAPYKPRFYLQQGHYWNSNLKICISFESNDHFKFTSIANNGYGKFIIKKNTIIFHDQLEKSSFKFIITKWDSAKNITEFTNYTLLFIRENCNGQKT
jgi:hypothetical protein